MTNYFSVQTFEKLMIMTWSPTRKVRFTALEETNHNSMLSFEDFMKVKNGVPWLFRQNTMVIKPYDGLSLPNSVEINEIAVWVQIHNLPDECRGKKFVKKSS
jgi:hypothetical protein